MAASGRQLSAARLASLSINQNKARLRSVLVDGQQDFAIFWNGFYRGRVVGTAAPCRYSGIEDAKRGLNRIASLAAAEQ